MYQIHRTRIMPDMRMDDLVTENPLLLLLLQHLEVDFRTGHLSVRELCSRNNLPEPLFLVLANLYNGFNPSPHEMAMITDPRPVILFLKNSHQYYKTDKYPEITGLIQQLADYSSNDELKLIEKFFAEYFGEVLEHLYYEEDVVFPKFMGWAEHPDDEPGKVFSASDYKDHHSDIETKLSDLKNLLLRHITINGALPLRRRLFFALHELEFDLNIHALVEEVILVPLMQKIESGG